jgi:hypothetical protein
MSRRGRRFLAWVFSVAAHLTVFAALFWPRAASPPPRAESPPILISLVALPKPEPPGPPNPIKAQAGGAQNAARPTPPHLAAPAPVLAAATPAPDTSDLAPDTSDLLSESQLTGATSAGEGGGGGGGSGCDTARIVQQALRRDPLVRMAVEDAHRLGRAIMLWNGDWVRSGEQDGKGLSAVREAIIWEVAFAPEACRNQRIHGLVLLSLADGGTRFAIGAGDWRWSDLLGARAAPSER